MIKVTLVVFASVYIAAVASAINGCKISLRTDITKDHPIILKNDKILYPSYLKSGVLEFESGPTSTAHLFCPNSKIIAGSTVFNSSTATLTCNSNKNFHIDGSEDATYNFDKIICSNEPFPVEIKATRSDCKKDHCTKIGYYVNPLDFLLIFFAGIDAKRVHSVATARVQHGVLYKQVSHENWPYQKGVSYDKFATNLTEAYSSPSYQRKVISDILGSDKEAEKWIPSSGELYLTAQSLISKDMLPYLFEQKASNFYSNQIPVWNTISNRKLVSEIVRRIVADSGERYLLSAGTIDVMKVQDGRGRSKKLYLTSNRSDPWNIPIPKFTYVLAVSEDTQFGIVFVTLNNPRVDVVTNDLFICKRIELCAMVYPVFNDTRKGLTYCCSVDDFAKKAPKIE